VFACGDRPYYCGPWNCFAGSCFLGYGVYGGATVIEYPYFVDNSVHVEPADVETVTVTPPDEETTEPDGAGSSANDARVAGLLEQGEKAFQVGHYGEARERFESAMKLAPDDPRSRVSFGLSDFALGNFGDAASAVHDAMAMAPDLAATPLDLGKGFGDAQSFQRQVDLLANLTRARPDDSRFQWLLGFVQYFGGDRTTGLQTFHQYTAAHPEDQTVGAFVRNAEGVSPPPRPQPPPSTRPYSVYQRPSAAVVEPLKRNPDGAVAQWRDENLRELALDQFSFARGLDRNGNRIAVEIVAKDIDDDTGALTKAKFKVRWVEWKTKTGKDRQEAREEKQKKTTIKLKFDEFGQFTEYCD